MDLNQLRDTSHEISKSKGWWDRPEDCSIPTKIALIHSEASEALEDYRNNDMEAYHSYKTGPSSVVLELESRVEDEGRVFMVHKVGGQRMRTLMTHELYLYAGYEAKPEGFPIELADILIRVGDLAGYLGIDLEEAVRMKTEYNRTRPERHGGKTV